MCNSEQLLCMTGLPTCWLSRNCCPYTCSTYICASMAITHFIAEEVTFFLFPFLADIDMTYSSLDRMQWVYIISQVSFACIWVWRFNACVVAPTSAVHIASCSQAQFQNCLWPCNNSCNSLKLTKSTLSLNMEQNGKPLYTTRYNPGHNNNCSQCLPKLECTPSQCT